MDEDDVLMFKRNSRGRDLLKTRLACEVLLKRRSELEQVPYHLLRVLKGYYQARCPRCGGGAPSTGNEADQEN
jgi:hypothetical protein